MSTDILDKVRALLAKAEATTFEAERETYNAKALELISRYGIDAALLETRKAVVESRRILIRAPYAKDKASFLSKVYRALGCRVIQLSRVQHGTMVVRAFGYASDLDRADILHTSLLVQGLRGMMQMDTAADRRAWLAGFGTTVSRRLEAAESHAVDVDTTPGTALVLVDRRVAVERELKAEYPNAAPVKRKLSGAGYGTGAAAGMRADIGQHQIKTA